MEAQLGTPLMGSKAWLILQLLVLLFVIKEEKCSLLSANDLDLPLAEIWYVPFLAPKQSQAIKVGACELAGVEWTLLFFLCWLLTWCNRQAERTS